jgi:hypothetical protein
MDGDTLKLILSNLEDVKNDGKESNEALSHDFEKLRDAVSGMDKRIVGQDNCTRLMEEFDARNRANNEVLRVEIATNHQRLMDEIGPIKTELQCYREQRIIVDYQKGLVGVGWKTVTSSPVLAFIVFLLSAITARVYWPGLNEMIAEWGLHITLALIGSIAVLLFLAWKGRRKIADAGRGLAWTI